MTCVTSVGWQHSLYQKKYKLGVRLPNGGPVAVLLSRSCILPLSARYTSNYSLVSMGFEWPFPFWDKNTFCRSSFEGSLTPVVSFGLPPSDLEEHCMTQIYPMLDYSSDQSVLYYGLMDLFHAI